MARTQTAQPGVQRTNHCATVPPCKSSVVAHKPPFLSFEDIEMIVLRLPFCLRAGAELRIQSQSDDAKSCPNDHNKDQVLKHKQV